MGALKQRPIRLLDDATIDRIAAGEAIERPASVVKELVENALDAGANSLKIEIEDGGLATIRVEDDGHGIPFRDLPLAFERHATSKITSAADITQVGSFGFRGEALASIAAVSRCEMISRSATDEVGGRIRLLGGETELREPAPRNRGTTVIVRDLFFNTPARRKFLASGVAEKRAVVTTVTTLALAHPEVRWLLVTDQTLLLDYRPAESLPARARDIFGPAIMEHMARFEHSDSGLTVSGMASRPTWTRGNRSQQYLYVNRRAIRSAALTHAIALSYRDVVPAGRHPVVILFLQVPAGELDVNVHPAKSEVRLLLERRVHALVRSALQEGLNLRNAVGTSGPAPALTAAAGAAEDSLPDEDETNETPLAGLARAEEDFLRRHFQQRTPGPWGSGGKPALDPATGQGTGPAAATDPDRQEDLFPVGDSGLPWARSVNGLTADATAAEQPLHAPPFWQLHRTYILTQIRGALVLIDQHNSHERILFNEAKRALAAGETGLPAQQLLFPAHLDLTPVQLQTYHAHHADLTALGFTIQPFGGQSILVQGIPASLKNWAEGQLLLDILDDLDAGSRDPDESRKQLLASYACHGAIRAGERLTLPEMQNLVDQLFATELPLSCPHGRPTLIQYRLEELEKRFGRR